MTTQQNLPLIWAYSGGVKDPGDEKYTGGWVAEIPSYQNFNFVLNNISTNNLVMAEKGTFEYEPTIAYTKGAHVLHGGVRYRAILNSTGIIPSDDVNYWTPGGILSSSGNAGLTYEEGFKLGTVNVRTNAGAWQGNDMTIANGSPNIFFRTANNSVKNWVLSNINGTMVFADVGLTNIPDGRDMYLAHADVHKIYHEGYAPTQSEVAGTIPDAPVDGPIYGRSVGNWVKVTSTTVSTSPPPPVAGSGQGWYNLDDGITYIDIDDGDSTQWVPASPPVLSELATSAEVNTGTNDKSIGPAALAGSDYVKEAYVDTRASVGYDQVWTDQPTRQVGIAYGNNTGRPIQVNVVMYGQNTDQQDSSLNIDGLRVARVVTNSGFSGFAGTLSAVVPHGSIYTVNVTTGMTINSWSELGR